MMKEKDKSQQAGGIMGPQLVSYRPCLVGPIASLEVP